ncbi:hypothetical protein Tsubulata_018084 [Turnera subulata]|uniref:Putative zinc-finger domain-containing protein n=1 Tax=Turnera subulata TaxID=218843 RepID=A0A9Q0FFA8_9ROSI|nr:hypothetical protein Tsubulata_018084 [Turnera subulata]
MENVNGSRQPDKPQSNTTKLREEGELSSSSTSDDDDNNDRKSARNDTQTPASTAAPPAGAVNALATAVPGRAPPSTSNPTAGIQSGKATYSINTASTIASQAQTPVEQNNAMSFQKSRTTFKSPNHEWTAASGDKNNLVISFSDDDSASESEDHKQRKASEVIGNRGNLDSNQGPGSRLLAKFSKVQQPTNTVNKVIPKRSSLSHTLVSSMKNNPVGTNSIGVAASTASASIEQGSRIRKFNTGKRNFSSQEHGLDQGRGLKNSAKLQDLREQIALRERELKLKAALLNKDAVSVSSRDCNAVNLGHDVAKKSYGTSGMEPKEPDRKRLKAGGSFSAMQTLYDQQDAVAAKTTLLSDGQLLGDNGYAVRNIADCTQRASHVGKMESSVIKQPKHDRKRVDISSENLPGIDITNNCSQTDGSRMQVDPCAVPIRTMPLHDTGTSILQKSGRTIGLNKNCGHQPSDSVINGPRNEENLVNGHGYPEGIYGGKASLNSICQASLNNASLWDPLCVLNATETSNMDMESLVEMEESLDKELEDAQQHRQKCESEERNALRAYRKAQRALFEANRRCTEIYRKRELHAANFRSFIINDSNMVWSPRMQKDVGPSNISAKMDIVPLSNDQIQPQYDQYVRTSPLNISYQHMNGHHLGSEPVSEPDASTSEQLPHNSKNAPNGMSSPSNDLNVSADEDEETFPLDHRTGQPSSKHKEQNSVGRKSTDCHSSENISIGSPDLELEAELRSKLVARLGMRTWSKNSGSSVLEPGDEPGTENDNGSERTQTSNESLPLSEIRQNQEIHLGGNDNTKSISEVQIEKHDKDPLNVHSADDSEDDYSGDLHLKSSSMFSPVSVLRSSFGQLKIMSAITPLVSQCKKDEKDNSSNGQNEGNVWCMNSEVVKWDNMRGNSEAGCVMDICGREVAVLTSDLVVDPFWPLCVFELRGKCNNDECRWQHFRDMSEKDVNQQHNDSGNAGNSQVAVSGEKCGGGEKKSTFECVLTPPTYLVGLDTLKANPHSYAPVVARMQEQCWLKCFSVCLVLSNILQKHLVADEPLLCGGSGRIENPPNLAPISNVQSLELALLILNEEVSKVEGMKKALCILSRAIEADPTSEILWITYLLVYYSKFESVGKDDMFFLAVKQNSRSYGLWVMYVNSRKHLDDRLAAYDAALSALCGQISAPEEDEMHASGTGLSACILDLFLQMIDCLRMSGNASKAIDKILGLLVETNSDEPHSLLLSDILSCLTISDKYMFWVCCVYFVIYRKLPDAVVQHFECEKELFLIEWPSVHLQGEDKQRAIKLVEMAVDSGKAYVNGESVECHSNIRSGQYFALNHIQCILVLEGLGCGQILLDQYMKLYSSCIELMLISARIQSNNLASSSSDGFGEALGNWPKELPGIQCIWNQYIEWALQKGDPEFVKELVARWLNSLSKLGNSENGNWDAMDCNDDSNRTLESVSVSNQNFLLPSSSQMDIIFSYINLSLAKLLHNDPNESRFAIDKALKAAGPQYFRYCLREHAAHVYIQELQIKKDFPLSKQLNILNGYLDDARALHVLEPLSRQFLNKIEKPKVKQLIGSILGPASFDSSLVNLVLEAWYGPSLLPEKPCKSKELVDFVEAILGIAPSNYQLVFSVLKLLKKEYNSVGVTSGLSILYWASSNLVNAIFHAIPIPPEYVWVEAAGILDDIADIELILDGFYKRALSAHPFSFQLLNFFSKLSKTRKDTSNIVEAAREKGIEVG